MTKNHPSSPDYWSTRYKEGRTGWDLKKHHPFLPTLRSYITGLKNKRVLVVGAGAGHDAEYFSHHGAQVTALDFSPEAKIFFNAYYPDSKVNYVIDDFFSFSTNNPFDLIVEHTLLCAIAPQRRADYFQSVSRNTKPKGLWAGIIWTKTGVDQGPPFSVPTLQTKNYLQDSGFQIHVERDASPCATGRENEFFILAKKG